MHTKSVEKTGHRRNRVVMGTTAVWIGILVAHLTFSLLFGGNALFLGAGIDSVFFTAVALFLGLAPAMFIGWGLGMPLGLLLRPVRNQWLHVAAFGALGLAIGLPFGAFADPPSILAAAGLGISSALGRFSAWTFVRVYDTVGGSGSGSGPGSEDDAGQPAPGTEVP
ncbi:hypothetical protein [Arthrobacter sp. CG_A4]|uniref:hypothetical protein n=1 Tax=Arthrobacter sp. CG_A4 TaxID=3071706 RepID=UPI002DFDE2CE|nr:vacuolar-type H+-ATPase subunit I/STV1 [Arthrobacter sp. CG_A4]